MARPLVLTRRITPAAVELRQVGVFLADEMELALARLGLAVERVLALRKMGPASLETSLGHARHGNRQQRGQHEDGLRKTALHKVSLL